MGIGPREETSADYYLIGDADHDGGDCNTFSKQDADRFVAQSKGRWRIMEIRKVPLVSVNRVMEENFGGARTSSRPTPRGSTSTSSAPWTSIVSVRRSSASRHWPRVGGSSRGSPN